MESKQKNIGKTLIFIDESDLVDLDPDSEQYFSTDTLSSANNSYQSDDEIELDKDDNVEFDEDNNVELNEDDNVMQISYNKDETTLKQIKNIPRTPKTKPKFDWREISDVDNFTEKNFLLPNSIENIVCSKSEIKNIDPSLLTNSTPYKVFSLFFTEKWWEYMRSQTNLYANQVLRNTSIKSSRTTSWKEFTVDKIKKYIGIILWMGIYGNTKIQGNIFSRNLLIYLSDNWSKEILHETNYAKFLSYNKFILIHRYFHLANNEHDDKTDPLYKIRPFIVQVSHLWRTLL